MTAKTLEFIASLIESPERSHVPSVVAGTLRRILAGCAVLACLALGGCHHSAAADTTIFVTITNPSTSPTIEQGQSVAIAASVANDSTNQGVSWTLSGFGNLSNTTTFSVTYTAPTSVTASTTVTVTAISIANPAITAVFSIHVTPPISVVISPSIATVPALGGTQGFAALVNYDQNSSGVSWALAGTGCSGSTCGTLANVTTTSVLYEAPPAQPTPNTVTLTATSIADKAQFQTVTIAVTPPSPIVVTISGKIASINAGGSAIQFTATAQNDPNNNGVTWALVVSGNTSCQPTCGTLSNITSGSVTYTPPISAPTGLPDQPTLIATSVSVPSISDTDSFTIAPSTSSDPCAGTPTGNESLLNKQYAFWLQGWQGSGAGTPVAIAASFGADGAGDVTGGELDINGAGGPQHLTINPSSGSYTVGLDPTDAGNLACITLSTTTGNMTFRMALGGISAGVASKGRIIEFDDSSGSGTIAAGILRLQDSTSFSTGSLQPNYAFGLDGADSKGAAVSIAGSFGVSTTAGATTIVNGNADINDSGTATSLTPPAVSGPLTGGTGTIAGISATTGRGTATFSIGTGHSYNWVIYMVNANEFFIVETDTLGSASSNPLTILTSGRAVVTASSFSSSSLSGNYIFHQSGIATCNNSPCAQVSLGLLNFGGSLVNGVPVVNGQLNQYNESDQPVQNQGNQSPIVQQSVINANYTVNSTSGRVSMSQTDSTLSFPVLYLASPPTDGVSAFIAGQDNTAMFGLAEFQPSQTYSASALAGNYLLGTEDPRDNAVPNVVGTLSITPTTTDETAAVLGTEDRSGQVGLIGGQTLSGTISITLTAYENQNGTGFVFSTDFLAITNGTKIFYIDTNSAQITVIELQ